ncbi:hypothetical protein BHM03_00051483 [Ensete ventricosum]|nr:hypothetical protein BHM03_00051483 [Ensete ventricosum]
MERCFRSWVRGGPVGAGSFGTVHLALHESTGYVSAVKSVSLSSSSPASVWCLENEIRILESICSPYIVTYLGNDTSQEPRAGTCRNLHVEYMPGGTVAGSAAAKGLSMDELQVCAYTRCVARALRYLHDVAGVVHCDVKGQNVLLGRDRGVAKLADFGAAMRIADASRVGDGPNWVRGTPLWMAPEVARGELPTPASDVWSLGCTVVEMVTGAHPWPNMATEDAVGALLKIGYGDEIPELPVRLSNMGRDFLDKCLRRNASERWTAEQLLRHPFLAEEAAIAEPSPRGVLEWATMELHHHHRDDDDYASCSYDHEDAEVMACARGRMRELASDGEVPGWRGDDWKLVRDSEEVDSVNDMEEEILVEGICQECSSVRSVGEPSGVGLFDGIRCSSSCCCCRCWRRRFCECGLGWQHGVGVLGNSYSIVTYNNQWKSTELSRNFFGFASSECSRSERVMDVSEHDNVDYRKMRGGSRQTHHVG